MLHSDLGLACVIWKICGEMSLAARSLQLALSLQLAVCSSAHSSHNTSNELATQQR